MYLSVLPSDIWLSHADQYRWLQVICVSVYMYLSVLPSDIWLSHADQYRWLQVICVSVYMYLSVLPSDIWLTHADQYRWLQVVYQVGVFLSRSSVNVFHIKRIWILTLLQVSLRTVVDYMLIV